MPTQTSIGGRMRSGSSTTFSKVSPTRRIPQKQPTSWPLSFWLRRNPPETPTTTLEYTAQRMEDRMTLPMRSVGTDAIGAIGKEQKATTPTTSRSTEQKAKKTQAPVTVDGKTFPLSITLRSLSTQQILLAQNGMKTSLKKLRQNGLRSPSPGMRPLLKNPSPNGQPSSPSSQRQ